MTGFKIKKYLVINLETGKTYMKQYLKHFWKAQKKPWTNEKAYHISNRKTQHHKFVYNLMWLPSNTNGLFFGGELDKSDSKIKINRLDNLRQLWKLRPLTLCY